MQEDLINTKIKKTETELIKKDRDGEVFEVIIREYNMGDKQELVNERVFKGENAREYIKSKKE